MIEDMGIFRTTIRVSSVTAPTIQRTLTDVMVDTGSEFNWIPADVLYELGIEPERVERFETADGSVIERNVGSAFIYAANRRTPTIVVFANGTDKTLLGAIGLEGMNLRVDLGRRELLPAGPIIVATAA
jgi:predicted aspartyl protease